MDLPFSQSRHAAHCTMVTCIGYILNPPFGFFLVGPLPSAFSFLSPIRRWPLSPSSGRGGIMMVLDSSIFCTDSTPFIGETSFRSRGLVVAFLDHTSIESPEVS